MLGDARDMAKKLKKPDRIIMNLPHSAMDFLDISLEIAAPGATIHLYTIQEKDTVDIIKGSIIKLAESMGRKAYRSGRFHRGKDSQNQGRGKGPPCSNRPVGRPGANCGATERTVCFGLHGEGRPCTRLIRDQSLTFR